MHTHKSSEARVRSRISTTRRLQGNRTQEASLKSYITLNAELWTKAKNDFEKYFFDLMNNLYFQKTAEM